MWKFVQVFRRMIEPGWKMAGAATVQVCRKKLSVVLDQRGLVGRGGPNRLRAKHRNKAPPQQQAKPQMPLTTHRITIISRLDSKSAQFMELFRVGPAWNP